MEEFNNLGISILEESISKRLGVNEGVVVRSTTTGTPTEQVGIQGTQMDRFGRIHLGDIIINIDGEKIRNYDDPTMHWKAEKSVIVLLLKLFETVKKENTTVDVANNFQIYSPYQTSHHLIISRKVVRPLNAFHRK